MRGPQHWSTETWKKPNINIHVNINILVETSTQGRNSCQWENCASRAEQPKRSSQGQHEQQQIMLCLPPCGTPGPRQNPTQPLGKYQTSLQSLIFKITKLTKQKQTKTKNQGRPKSRGAQGDRDKSKSEGKRRRIRASPAHERSPRDEETPEGA